MEENKLSQNNLKYELVDSDIWGGDDAGCVYVDIYKQDNKDVGVTAFFEVSWDSDNFEFHWEPDGEPTYVPYGDTSVEYDNGEGGLESVDVYADCDNYYFIELGNSAEEGIDLSKEQVLQILGCSEEELDHLMQEIEAKVISHAEDLLLDYYEDPDHWPEKPEYEPDYDNWYLDRDDWN